jgi:Skp family chaperone for outer membrane proteins
MKRIAFSILAAGIAAAMGAQTASPATVSPASPAAAPGAIAIIDAQRLALESAPGKEAYGRLQKLSGQKKEELDRVEKEARDLVQKLSDQGSSMPADKLEALQKQADDKQKTWKRMQEDAQKDLQEAERKEMAALEGRIGPIVKEFFRERHYSLVLDSRAGIMYADDAVNVTEEVLKRINTSVALPQAKPADTAAKSQPGTQSQKSPAAPPAKPTPAPKKPS